MLSGKESQLLAVLLVLVLVTPGSAAPTAGQCDISPVGLATWRASSVDCRYLSATGTIVNLAGFDLSWAPPEVADPQMNWVHPTDSTAGHAKSLPAIPGALLMALTGFLCVSLVKDRSVWLTAAIGLLCLVQTGLVALPHLARHPRSVISFLRNHGRRSGFQTEQESRYLAPRFTVGSSLVSAKIACSFSAAKERPLLQFAITDISPCLLYATNCPAGKAGQLVRVSPVFTFARFARGPPNRA